jgi:hypothetical protein
MKLISKLGAIILLVLVLVHSSCKKEKTVTTSSQVIKLPPIADAGSDQTILLPVDSVALVGQGIDPDGSVVSYSWKHASGPLAFTIANANNAVTKVNNLVEGAYVFELTVRDNDGLTAWDNVIIFVGDPLDSCAGCWD